MRAINVNCPFTSTTCSNSLNEVGIETNVKDAHVHVVARQPVHRTLHRICSRNVAVIASSTNSLREINNTTALHNL